MKAERRHELRENSLVRGVKSLPEFWQAYGSKIALGAIVVLLAILLTRMWRQQREDAARKVGEELSAARSALEELRRAGEGPPRDPRLNDPQMAQFARFMPPLPFNNQEAVAKQRSDVWSKVDMAASVVLRDSTDPAQQAEAKLLRADANYHWALLATLGNLPDAATRPSLAIPDKADDYLGRAATNYQAVLDQASALPPAQGVSARLGLAAVAEGRSDFAKARELYEAVQAQTADQVASIVAKVRLQALAAAKPDLLVGPPKTLAGPAKPELPLPDGPQGPLGPMLPKSATTQSAPATGASTVPATATPATAPALTTTAPAATTQAATAPAP